jgi:outer membrane protein TolC
VERSWQTAELGLIRARANRFVDTVQLYGALGGGWWARDDTTADEGDGATHGRMDSTMANESR